MRSSTSETPNWVEGYAWPLPLADSQSDEGGKNYAPRKPLIRWGGERMCPWGAPKKTGKTLPHFWEIPNLRGETRLLPLGSSRYHGGCKYMSGATGGTANLPDYKIFKKSTPILYMAML